MNIKKNNMFKKDFNYPLFIRVSKISDTPFSYILKWRIFLFNKKKMTIRHLVHLHLELLSLINHLQHILLHHL